MLFEEIINVKTKKKKKFFTEETNKHYNIYSKLYDLYNNAKVIDLIIEASLQDMMGAILSRASRQLKHKDAANYCDA